MSNDERRSEDAQWIERVREGWQAPASTPNQRAAFDDRLEEHLQERPRASWLRPVGILATSAVAAALLWNASLSVTQLPEELAADAPRIAEADSFPTTPAEIADAWLEFGEEAYAIDSTASIDSMDPSLPDDYAAIESLLFGG